MGQGTWREDRPVPVYAQRAACLQDDSKGETMNKLSPLHSSAPLNTRTASEVPLSREPRYFPQSCHSVFTPRLPSPRHPSCCLHHLTWLPSLHPQASSERSLHPGCHSVSQNPFIHSHIHPVPHPVPPASSPELSFPRTVATAEVVCCS